MARLSIAAVAAAALTLANAQSISKQCPFNEICFSLNLPMHTFLNGGGELYFQIDGPDTYSWIGLGQGDKMEGANMFVIYANGKGNVTLSPRLGKDMAEPKFNPDAEVQLLAGSGVANGRMTANVRCKNCDKWEGGSMDLKSDMATWIGAGLPGQALDSTDPEARIEKHFVHSAFPFNMIEARGGGDISRASDSYNPFYTPRAQYPQQGELQGVGTPMAVAHGVLASLAFLVILPAGAIFVRFARFKGLVWVHASIQIGGYLVYVVAAGLGIHMLLTYPPKYYRYDIYSDPHPKVGMALLGYLFLQPISGFINHWLFGKKGKRPFSHHIHIWGGRIAILLGFVNGGMGLRLGHVEYTGYKIAYGLVATVTGLLFIANIVFAVFHRDAPNPSALHSGKHVEDGAVGNGEGHHVRMESMEDRERLHATSGERVE